MKNYKPILFFKLFLSLVMAGFFNLTIMAQVFYNPLDDETLDDIWLGQASIKTGLAHTGYYFSLTDSVMPYGLGIETTFPENQWSNDINMKISAWIIADTNFADAIFVVTISKNGNQLFWKGIPVAQLTIEKEKWYEFQDSVIIPRDVAKEGTLKAYLWNPQGKNKIGIDDLKFEFQKINGTSYLPDILPDTIVTSINNSNLIFSNSYFSIYYNDGKNTISVYGKNMEPIINNLKWVFELADDSTELELLNNLVLKNAKRKKDKSILNFKGKNEYANLDLSILCDKYSAEIIFETAQKFKKQTDVSRSAIVFDMAQKASEIYRYNRHLDTSHFADEYWLDKEGLKIGENENSLLIYHCPDISSIQHSNKKSQIFINLDWQKDHPFFRFPLMPDSNNYKLEQSQSSFERGDKSINHFSAYAGSDKGPIARFMKNPDGYEATYIWTEHADYTDISTNRATYYGSEKISDPDSAIGGFVKYKIQVTKSVFYDNPDSIDNKEASKGIFNSLESTIKTDTTFGNFLFDIHKKGNEICLHTPEQYTTTRERLEDALAYMQKQFGSPSWIDHGNNNGLENNREDLICDGTLKDSPWFAKDLWEKYGVKYLHNAYFEEYLTFYSSGFGTTIEKPYSGWADNLPNPDYWQHKTKTGNIIHWQTPNVLFVDNESLWNYFFNKQNMNDFISNWSVKFNHCYPAWTDPKKGFWKFDSDSSIVAQDGFNNTLKLMSDYRDMGKLNVTTIQDFLDYRIATDSVEYTLLPDGRIKVTNNSNIELRGLSFATKAAFVLVDRLKPQQKNSENNIIFWFDIKAGESKIIRLID